MSEPKISRRCPACGASIRERAFFCPQCGKALEDSDVNSSVVPATQPLSEPPAKIAEPLSDTIVESAPVTSSDKTRKLDGSSRDKKRDRNRNRRQPILSEAEEGKVRPTAGVGPQSSESNVLQRVEKLRKVSSVVLDEAAYDPSLRFILVAAVLFILFLVIVILNKVIG
jgi:hypothetical protein